MQLKMTFCVGETGDGAMQDLAAVRSCFGLLRWCYSSLTLTSQRSDNSPG